jgi:hypothetical protein
MSSDARRAREHERGRGARGRDGGGELGPSTDRRPTALTIAGAVLESTPADRQGFGHGDRGARAIRCVQTFSRAVAAAHCASWAPEHTVRMRTPS